MSCSEDLPRSFVCQLILFVFPRPWVVLLHVLPYLPLFFKPSNCFPLFELEHASFFNSLITCIHAPFVACSLNLSMCCALLPHGFSFSVFCHILEPAFPMCIHFDFCSRLSSSLPPLLLRLHSCNLFLDARHNSSPDCHVVFKVLCFVSLLCFSLFCSLLATRALFPLLRRVLFSKCVFALSCHLYLRHLFF